MIVVPNPAAWRRRLFAVIDGRYPGDRCEHLGVRTGRCSEFLLDGKWSTTYDSYPPGPSLYALWAIDDARGAA